MTRGDDADDDKWLPFDVEAWFHLHALPRPGAEMMRQILQSEPFRRVRARKGHVICRYTSSRMRRVIQAESKLELGGVINYEHSLETLCYLDQPKPRPWLDYRQTSGRHVRFETTPDYFVVEKHWAGWDEWKPEAKLVELAKLDPVRWVAKGSEWRCPPAEAAAAAFGFGYRVRTEKSVDLTHLTPNLDFLQDFMNSDLPYEPSAAAIAAIVDVVKANPGITLAKLLDLLR